MTASDTGTRHGRSHSPCSYIDRVTGVTPLMSISKKKDSRELSEWIYLYVGSAEISVVTHVTPAVSNFLT